MLHTDTIGIFLKRLAMRVASIGARRMHVHMDHFVRQRRKQCLVSTDEVNRDLDARRAVNRAKVSETVFLLYQAEKNIFRWAHVPFIERRPFRQIVVSVREHFLGQYGHCSYPMKLAAKLHGIIRPFTDEFGHH